MQINCERSAWTTPMQILAKGSRTYWHGGAICFRVNFCRLVPECGKTCDQNNSCLLLARYALIVLVRKRELLSLSKALRLAINRFHILSISPRLVNHFAFFRIPNLKLPSRFRKYTKCFTLIYLREKSDHYLAIRQLNKQAMSISWE